MNEKLTQEQEDLIAQRFKEAQMKKQLPPEVVEGWTDGASSTEEAQARDAANESLQDMSTDPVEERKKRALATREYDQGTAKRLSKEEGEFMKSLPKVPRWKRFTGQG